MWSIVACFVARAIISAWNVWRAKKFGAAGCFMLLSRSALGSRTGIGEKEEADFTQAIRVNPNSAAGLLGCSYVW